MVTRAEHSVLRLPTYTPALRDSRLPTVAPEIATRCGTDRLYLMRQSYFAWRGHTHRSLQIRSRALHESKPCDLIVWRLPDCTHWRKILQEARHQSGAADLTFLARTLISAISMRYPVFRGDAGITFNLNLLAAFTTTGHVTSPRKLVYGIVKYGGPEYAICTCADIKAGCSSEAGLALDIINLHPFQSLYNLEHAFQIDTTVGCGHRGDKHPGQCRSLRHLRRLRCSSCNHSCSLQRIQRSTVPG